jgi:hypothetical protein
MADLVKRLNYFNGQFLRENDFNDEQGYHVQNQRDHARLMHTPGIAEGLEIPDLSGDTGVGFTAVTVNAGVAYDDQGRRILLADNAALELADLPADQAIIYVTIAYGESQTDPTDETGITGNTRWTEAPLIETSTTAPANPNEKLVLARVNRTGTTVSAINRTDRRTAGVRGGDLEVTSLTLKSSSFPGSTVRTELGAIGQADVGGSLRVVGDLVVTGSIQGNIAVNTIETGDLVDNAVTSAKLANAAVTNAKLADNSVNAAKIVEGSIGPSELLDGAVTTAKLADGAVTLQKLAPAVRPIVSLNLVSNPGGNVELLAASAININNDLANHRITISEVHSTVSGNPHGTTAAQVGALPVTGGSINGSLGIGVQPGFPLDVHGRMRVRQVASGENTAGIWLSGYYQQEFDAAFVGMRDYNSVGFWGNAGAANWRMWVTLDQGIMTITGNAFKPGGGAWGTSSDERLKQDIRPLEGALEKLLRLKPVIFEWKEPEKQGNLTGPQMGFLAQDVESVFPDWVGVDPGGYRTLTIRGFEALVVEALKELKGENDKLKEECARMQERIDGLEKKRRRQG